MSLLCIEILFHVRKPISSPLKYNNVIYSFCLYSIVSKHCNIIILQTGCKNLYSCREKLLIHDKKVAEIVRNEIRSFHSRVFQYHWNVAHEFCSVTFSFLSPMQIFLSEFFHFEIHMDGKSKCFLNNKFILSTFLIIFTQLLCKTETSFLSSL